MNYTDLASHVTARLVARVEAGAGCRSMPWHTNPGLLDVRNAATGLPYRGANTITLAVAALDCGYPAGWWATYRQWSELGAQVRRGETAARIVKWVPGRATDDHDSDSDDRRLVPKVYAVFNAAQVDGWAPPAAPTTSVLERNEHADAWIAATRADITYGHDHACYRPARDRIELPAAEQFTDRAAFYSTTCHELMHWTGHQSRLARDLTGRFGDDAYAAENSSPSSAPPSPAHTSASPRHRETTTRPTSPTASASSARTPRHCSPSPPKPKPPSTTSTATAPPATPTTRPPHDPCSVRAALVPRPAPQQRRAQARRGNLLSLTPERLAAHLDTLRRRP